ncbi:2-succinyl-5-enolpyruvyl-6-hydroxy-3-cyclohexene-1-carboxylic-acid synthase [Flavobacteriales bacterium]|nr:2-succinyl-5-enolpyruvyl-6-hydroxy-3-cyclohexene-1-carboxylic-acid synthase [Flavobacteriales bacterium]
MTASGSPAMASANALVAGLSKNGLGAVVVSPGSRNAPLIQASALLDIEVVVALDERSAAHHALGMALALKQPVAVCCTSGTAALNHGPALAEAQRVGLPLISLTADRPAGAHNTWQSQTLVQNDIHAQHVSGSFTWDHPEGHVADDLLQKMARTLEQGPIHINCPFDVPLYPAEALQKPLESHPKDVAPSAQDRLTKAAQAPPSWFQSRLEQAVAGGEKVLLLGGTQPAPLSAESLKFWSRFALIAGDTTSGLFAPGIPAISACDRWLNSWQKRGRPATDMAPDLVVTFGAPLVSRRLREALAALDFEHLHMGPSGEAPHAFARAPRPVRCDVNAGIEAGAAALRSTEDGPMDATVAAWHRHWWDQESALRAAHDAAVEAAPWSDLRAHRCLHMALPKAWDLHLGNSTPVRYAQLFEGTGPAHPWSNRGVAGIDGCNSTAVGSALAGRPTTLITGELGFLYDANAFHIQPLPHSLRIAVIHNGGGGIFRWLDGPAKTGLLERHFEWKHATALHPLCALHGLIHQRVKDEAGLQEALKDWWAPSAAPQVLEIVTPGPESAEAYARYMEAVCV